MPKTFKAHIIFFTAPLISHAICEMAFCIFSFICYFKIEEEGEAEYKAIMLFVGLVKGYFVLSSLFILVASYFDAYLPYAFLCNVFNMIINLCAGVYEIAIFLDTQGTYNKSSPTLFFYWAYFIYLAYRIFRHFFVE